MARRSRLQRAAAYLLLTSAAVMGAVGGYLVAVADYRSVTVFAPGVVFLLFALVALVAYVAAWSRYVPLRLTVAVIVLGLGYVLIRELAWMVPIWMQGRSADFSIDPASTLIVLAGVPVAVVTIMAPILLIADAIGRYGAPT